MAQMYVSAWIQKIEWFANIGNWQHHTKLLVLQTCMGLIRPMQDKAYKMHSAGAYLHQYKQFGIDKQDFDSCFARIEDTYASYQAL